MRGRPRAAGRGPRAARRSAGGGRPQHSAPARSPPTPPAPHPTLPPQYETRGEHNRAQAEVFERPEVVREFMAPVPADVDARVAQIVASVPGLGPESRVIDAGCGTGCLIPHLQVRLASRRRRAVRVGWVAAAPAGRQGQTQASRAEAGAPSALLCWRLQPRPNATQPALSPPCPLQSRGVADITAVDLSAAMLEGLAKRFPSPGTVGNEKGARARAAPPLATKAPL
jgi:hypothetical protein